MTPQTEAMLDKLRETKRYWPELGIKRLALFGSYARGDATPNSDVDLLAEFTSPTGFIELFAKRDRFVEMLQIPVDLHSMRGINPQKHRTHKYITKDMLYVE